MDAMASISERVGDLGDYLREQREAAKLSVRQLSVLAGVSNPYLSQIERGLRKPSAEVLQQLAKGLRISAEALYVRAGILDGEGRPDVELAIGSDPRLTDRQRRALLDIYASFRAENERVVVATAPSAAAAAGSASPAKRTGVTRVAVKRASRKAAAASATPTASVAKKTVAKKAVTKKAAATKAAATKTAVTKTARKRAVRKTAAPVSTVEQTTAAPPPVTEP